MDMIAGQRIPVHTTLSDVFGSLEASLPHAVRWNNLAEQFEKRFGRKPAYIARAPGRVNLIGEHIDYALFGVLPAAVERDILIACGPRAATSASHHSDVIHAPGSVVAENLHSKYTRQVFAPASKIAEEVSDDDARVAAWHLDINTNELRWESYVKAGYYGVLNHHFSDGEEDPVPVDLLVTGSVPAGSGLSSSAAMVVASTLAFLAVNGKLEEQHKVGTSKSLNKGELVQLAMQNEKRVGVNSGGMDQAASVMSDPSSALYISFYPSLTASAVPLPIRAVFVCANSLVVADKALSAKRGYNLRVVETLVAARILAISLGVQIGEKDRITFREVIGKFAGEKDGDDMGAETLEKTLAAMDDKLGVLKPNRTIDGKLGVTMDEMIEMSGLRKDIFDEVYLSWVDIEATHFQLFKRAKHVFSEARRVLQFRRTCLESAKLSDANDTAFFEKLGQLMNDSQSSCSQLFECSCPELDELTNLAREAGAFGSRLTGAGWGGCTVSLVAEGKVNEFIQKVKATYPPYRNLEGDALNEVIFATKPGSGACVYKLER
ncbi:galactokinase gal [Crassisporium funariophilum]|nr:galactokinase gal [Crassisporium funariophilum]